jgi:hypothetical protein
MMVDIEICPTWQFGVKMNIEQAKAKLDSISKSTSTKHPKVLVGELCVIVKFLLDELDRIKTPTLTVLSTPDDAVKIVPPPRFDPDLIPKRPSTDLPGNTYGRPNAGDAE